MKRFNQIFLSTITVLILVGIMMTLIIPASLSQNRSKGYLVEVNRIMDAFRHNGLSVEESFATGDDQFIKDIKYLSADNDAEAIARFFEGMDVKNGYDHLVKPYIEDHVIKGYLRFEYIKDNADGVKKVMWSIYFLISGLLTIVIVLFVYIKRQILSPFHKIQELPIELSKGHLTIGTKENKNRFFGKFLWGLDMLRENLEQHKKRTLELEKEKKLMLLSISHDIKTPLSSIKLYAKAIRENLYETQEKRNQIVCSIEENADRIEGFISEIMKMSTNNLLDIQVEDGEFYLAQLIEKIWQVFGDKLKLLRTSLTIEEFQNILLRGDMNRILEVLENIVENALKYGDGISLYISFSTEDYCQLIHIENSGQPVSLDESVHMFESFWRGTNAQGKKGNGLGLYICKQIMLKMGGDIYAECLKDTTRMTLVIRQM